MSLGSLGFQRLTGCLESFHVCYVILFSCCLRFKRSPHLLHLFRRKQESCFTANPQKCFADYETLPDFPSTWT